MTTNSITFVNKANRILILDNGKITFNGTYKEIQENKDFQEIQKISDNFILEERKRKSSSIGLKPIDKFDLDEINMRRESPEIRKMKRLVEEKKIVIEEEEKKTGRVSFKVIKKTLDLMGGVFLHALLFCTAFGTAITLLATTC